MIIRYVFHSTVKNVEHREVTVSGKKDENGQSVFIKQSIGWFVLVDQLAFSVGVEEPKLKAGDQVMITIEGEVE